MFYFNGTTPGFSSNFIDKLRVVANKIHLVETQFGIAPLSSSDGIGVLEILKAKSSDGKGIRTDPRNLFIDVNVESLQNGQYDHERRYADDHSQKCEKRPQLMRPNGGEGEF